MSNTLNFRSKEIGTGLINLEICSSLDALSEAAARLFTRTAAESMIQRGRFLVALSGGSTPGRLFELLARPPSRDLVDWQRAFVFWADERCVPPDDRGSNYKLAWDALLAHVPIPVENLQRIKGELEPAEAARDYARTLKAFASPPLDWPRFDLVLLGMGADGHTASLFPGSAVETSAPTQAVTANYQGRPAKRVTLTPPVFNAARRVLFLVSGESKSAALARVIDGDYHPEQLPAQRIRPTDGEVTWLIDQAAASTHQDRKSH